MYHSNSIVLPLESHGNSLAPWLGLPDGRRNERRRSPPGGCACASHGELEEDLYLGQQGRGRDGGWKMDGKC